MEQDSDPPPEHPFFGVVSPLSVQEFEQFNKRLADVSRHVRIPLPVSNVLWEHCIRLANRTLVEG